MGHLDFEKVSHVKFSNEFVLADKWHLDGEYFKKVPPGSRQHTLPTSVPPPTEAIKNMMATDAALKRTLARFRSRSMTRSPGGTRSRPKSLQLVERTPSDSGEARPSEPAVGHQQRPRKRSRSPARKSSKASEEARTVCVNAEGIARHKVSEKDLKAGGVVVELTGTTDHQSGPPAATEDDIRTYVVVVQGSYHIRSGSSSESADVLAHRVGKMQANAERVIKAQAQQLRRGIDNTS